MAGPAAKLPPASQWVLLREGAISYGYVLIWIVLSVSAVRCMAELTGKAVPSVQL